MYESYVDMAFYTHTTYSLSLFNVSNYTKISLFDKNFHKEFSLKNKVCEIDSQRIIIVLMNKILIFNTFSQNIETIYAMTQTEKLRLFKGRKSENRFATLGS